jgi:hypothetical protein
MSYRRRHRWFRRMALGIAFSAAVFAGHASVAAAKVDEGTGGSRYVAAGGWSGLVDMETGIPLAAGIPHGDEQFIDEQAPQVIPYLAHGILTQEDAEAAAAKAIHDPYLTDVFVRPGESLGGPDGGEVAFGNAVVAAAGSLHDPLTADELNAINQPSTVIPYISHGIRGEAAKTNVAPAKFVPGVTDFPTTSQPAPDNRVERALEQGPQVIPYLSQGMTSDDVVGVRPDDRADRFAHSDVPTPTTQVSNSGSTVEWNDALTVGIGALVLVLGLGLALGYLRRPRLAI